MELKRAALVLADISGYTRFMHNHKMTMLHAEHIITQLLESVIDQAEFPLTIAKLEGDAVFMYAFCPDDDQRDVVRDVQNQVEMFFKAFNAKAEELMIHTFCTCEACSSIDKLRLKAVVHHGDVAFKKIRQFEELAGENVILVHRLIKNSIPSKEYIALTDAFYKLSGGLADQEPEFRTEDAEGIGKTKIAVYYIDPAERPLKKERGFAAVRRNLPLAIKSFLVAWGLRKAPSTAQFTNIPDAV